MRIWAHLTRRSRVLLLAFNVVVFLVILNQTGKVDDIDEQDDFLEERPPPIVVADIERDRMPPPRPKPLEIEDIGYITRFKNRRFDEPQPQASSCQNLPKPAPSKPFIFHRVQSHSTETFVFSAFFDPRTDPAVVRVFGMSSGGDLPINKYCQVWYKHQKEAEVFTADYNIVPETHDLKYAPSIHVCRLRRDAVPELVSLVSNKCDLATHALVIKDPKPSQPPHINFTVCVTPLNFNYDNANELTEMIEMNRLLGAKKITFYNHTSGPQVHKVLKHYVDSDVVQVIPWDVPVPVDTWPKDPNVTPEIHYFAQLLALNDCLFRHMFTSKFIVFTDLDEFIVPKEHSTWTAMLSKPISYCNDLATVGSYLFQNTFFRRDWPSDKNAEKSAHVSKLQLITQLKLTREKNIWPHYSRSKYIVAPKLVVQIGVHFVFDFVDINGNLQCEVPEDVALLHHYRLWEDEGTTMTQVRDTTMLRYKKPLFLRVSKTLRKIGLLPRSL